MLCLSWKAVRNLKICISLFMTYSVGFISAQKSLELPKIGVVGGGIGGTSTAYFLTKLLNNNLMLDLYEPGHIGGRLSTSQSLQRKYEVGGTIIHPQNAYMNDFIKIFGLFADFRKNGDCGGKLGVFDGKQYAFIESNWEIINIAKLFWRYGLDVFYLQKETNNMLENFSRIYKLQSEGFAYKSITELVQAVDPKFSSLLRMSFRDHMLSLNFNELLIDELVTAITRVNYGQLASTIHAFVGSVALAGATPDLWSVYGGNFKVPEELLKASEANLIQKTVSKITQMDEGKFRVYSQAEDSSDVTGNSYVEYDAVAIATPLTKDTSNLQFVNFSKPLEFKGSYKKIFSTLVEGALNEETFVVKDGVDEIVTWNPSLFYNSVGRQKPVDTEDKDDCFASNSIYKVFSPEHLSADQLKTLFRSVNRTEVKEWLAYPYYTVDESFDDFELVPGLYYNNAIEKLASAMEMSVIGAKNVALLIRDHLEGKPKEGSAHPKEEL